MKILKTFAFLVLVCFMEVHANSISPSHWERYSQEECFNENGNFGDIRAKALTIINMIEVNKAKSKEKILSVLLEVEINILQDKINKKIKQQEASIANQRQWINKENRAEQIKDMLGGIETHEKLIIVLEEALQLSEQWKRDYCRN